LNANQKNRLVAVGPLAVTIGAAWLVLHAIDWGTVIRLLARANLLLVSLAGMSAALHFAILVYRWRAIIKMLGGVSAAGTKLALGLGRSMLFSQILPPMGGDVVLIVAVAGHTGTALAARSVMCDRVVGLAVLMLLVVAVLPFLASPAGAGPALITLATVSLGGLAIFLFHFAHSDRLSRVPWIGRYLALIATDLGWMFIKRPMAQVVLLLTLAAHFLCVFMIYDLAHALEASISFFQCLVIVPPALLISAVPISVGGWGVREGALAAGFAMIGASSEVGVAASVLYGLSFLLIGAIAALAMPLMLRWNITPKDAI
jgi:glycosyltransferase 2 family protein